MLEMGYFQVHSNYVHTKSMIQLLCMFGSLFWDYNFLKKLQCNYFFYCIVILWLHVLWLMMIRVDTYVIRSLPYKEWVLQCKVPNDKEGFNPTSKYDVSKCGSDCSSLEPFQFAFYSFNFTPKITLKP